MSALTDLTPGIWTIDPSHTSLGFVARHLVVAKVRGRFGAVTGVITVAEDALASSVTAQIDMASVDTGDTARDEHLRSADFFDVENHPSMTFTSTSVSGQGADYVVTGDLTIKGVTRPVTLDLEFDGVSGDPWGGTRAGFTATAEIDRRHWGLEWNVALDTGGVLVGEKVKLQLDIEAVKG